MKKVLIIIILLSAVSGNGIAKTGEHELGRRYLKLGNTYREEGNSGMAEKYLLKGYTIVKKYSDFYWIAVAEEYLGYYYIDTKELPKALKYLKSAKSIYNVYGKLRNGEGSNKAIEAVIAGLDNKQPGTETEPNSNILPEKESQKQNPVKDKSLKRKPRIFKGKLPDKKQTESVKPIEESMVGETKAIETGDALAHILKQQPEEIELTVDEQKLYRMIMDYRKQKALPVIPLSKSLSYVAKVHVIDLENNFTPGGECNLHSWSEGGRWSPVCYTPDHKNAELMWNKPGELTNYKGNGYEISAGASNYKIEAATALRLWQNSTGHNNVIINGDIWNNVVWKAIGIGMYRGYACVWFGKEPDTTE